VVHFGSRALHRPRELILLLILLTALALLLWFVPGIGLIDKAATHGASITDRQDAMRLALPGADGWRWLLGHGLFYESMEAVESAGSRDFRHFRFGAIGFVITVDFPRRRCSPARSYADGCRYLTLIAPFIVHQPVFSARGRCSAGNGGAVLHPPPVRKGLAGRGGVSLRSSSVV